MSESRKYKYYKRIFMNFDFFRKPYIKYLKKTLPSKMNNNTFCTNLDSLCKKNNSSLREVEKMYSYSILIENEYNDLYQLHLAIAVFLKIHSPKFFNQLCYDSIDLSNILNNLNIQDINYENEEDYNLVYLKKIVVYTFTDNNDEKNEIENELRLRLSSNEILSNVVDEKKQSSPFYATSSRIPSLQNTP